MLNYVPVDNFTDGFINKKSRSVNVFSFIECTKTVVGSFGPLLRMLKNEMFYRLLQLESIAN
jgi:hypothetical protein